MAKGLRRELGPFTAMALSVGLMAPSLAASLNGAGIAQQVGSAAPFVILISAVGIGFVAYSFIRLTRVFNHAGSVYALTGVTLGPRAGFFSGWALLGVYLAFVGSTLTAIDVFGLQFLNATHIWDGANWVVVTLVAAVLALLLTSIDIKAVARVLMSIEGVTILLIVIVSVIVLVQVAQHGGPTGSTAPPQNFTLSPFTPSGLGLGVLAAATVLGFFSFAGFEGSASLGEETANPTLYIPLAIAAAVGIGVILFLLAMFAQTLGFGTDANGVAAYGSSAAPMGDIGNRYVGSWMGNVLNLGALFGSFGSLMGSTAGAGRMLFAMSRDGFGPKVFSKVWDRTGAPAAAIAFSVATGLVALSAIRIAAGTGFDNIYFYLGTIGSLSLLVAYGMTGFGAVRHVIRTRSTAWAVEIAVLLLGIAFVAYVLYKSLYPAPPSPYNIFPYIVGAWLAVGLGIVFLSPGLATAIGGGLAKIEGFATSVEGQPAVVGRADGADRK
jgi:amino acid transporter